MPARTVTVKPSAGDYLSLNAALAGESADLVTNTRLLTIECYAMTDTTAATTGTGYTTNASYYIYITCPATERHAGVWNDAKYNLAITFTGNGGALIISENFTVVEYLQIWSKCNGTITYHQSIRQSTSGITPGYIDKCIFKYSVISGSSTYNSAVYWYEGDHWIRRCIAYDYATGFSSEPVSGADGYYNNCTVDNCATGYSSSIAGGSVTKNCGASNSITGFNNCTQTTCSTTTPTYLDEAGNNFHLGAADITWKNAGTDLSGETWPPTLDIDGETVVDTWDIGADEYIAAGATLEQKAFRFRNDDGNEAAATWIDAQDTNITRAKNTNTRLRMLLQATGDPPASAFQIECRKQGIGNYKKIN